LDDRREDIIALARDAGCEETWGMDAFRFTIEELEKFFALATAQERAACAKVCEGIPLPQDTTALTHLPTIERCAAAIRARGQV